MPKDARSNQLAQIHIARKDLGLDEATYRGCVQLVSRGRTETAADLSFSERAQLIENFRKKGWKNRLGRQRAQRKRASFAPASRDQVALIGQIWSCLGRAGHLKNPTDTGLRRWVQSTTRREPGANGGFAAPELLPYEVAQSVIERLKAWAVRTEVTW